MSRTVTVNDFVEVLLCVSVAVQTTVVVPSGKVLPVAGLHFRLETASSGARCLNVERHGRAGRTGCFRSDVRGHRDHRWCRVGAQHCHVERLACGVAVSVGRGAVDGGRADGKRRPRPGRAARNDPRAVHEVGRGHRVADALPAGLLVLVVTSAGTVKEGAVVSRTVTWNAALEWFSAASLAEHVTVVVPSPNVEPEAGEQEELVTPTASEALGE